MSEGSNKNQKGEQMEEFDKQLKRAKEILIEKTKCTDIVLFGSFYRGDYNAESDVDLAIRTSEKLSSKEIFEIARLLEDIFNRDVDLIDLDQIENDGFRYEILINGKTIYSENEYEFDLYKLDMYREYLELNESRQEIIKQIKS